MKKTLIVVDMQNDFIDMALGTKEAVAIVPAVKAKIEEYKSKGNEIIYTRDTHGEDYMDTQEGKNLPVAHCIKGTDGWQLNHKIADALKGKNYKTVEKLTFGSVDLSNLVKEAIGEEKAEITLIGLCTDICVVSNALLLKANLLDCEIFVDASCCAGVTPDTHNAALDTMRCCQINII